MKQLDKVSSLKQEQRDLSDRSLMIGFVLVIIIASLLRIYQLDSQLWLDEFSVIQMTVKISWWEIVTVWPGIAVHVLYELLANWSALIFGENEFSIRLPAALSGIAGVVIIARLGMHISTMKAGLFIAALLAFSYNHVFFSQNARGYTLLIFLFLWSSYLFIRIADDGRMPWRAGLLYCLVTVLTCYSQPFGVFIPAAQTLIAVVLVAIYKIKGDSFRFPIKAFITWMCAAAVLTLIIYAPLFEGMISHATMNIDTPEEGPRFTLDLLIEIVEGLSAAFYGYAGLAVVTLFGSIGMIIWLRYHALSVFVLMLPIFVQALVFFIMGVGIHPRYFAIAIPVIYIAGGITIFYLSDFVLNKIISNATTRQLTHSTVLALVVIVSAYPLLRYYSIPKQDFQGALHFVEQASKKDDIKVGIQSVGPIMTDYYGSNYIRVDNYDQLLELEKNGGRIWVVMTLERIMSVADPALVEHIRKDYNLLKRLPGTVGDGSIQIYRKP